MSFKCETCRRAAQRVHQERTVHDIQRRIEMWIDGAIERFVDDDDIGVNETKHLALGGPGD